ncbi:MAG: hypothetical protein E7562_03805 [Ruminococcaceae bacterium]|nr:hypothetical protein [Oscillospiraceae bacterium]
MWWIVLAFAAVLLGIALYLYTFIKRSFVTFGAPTDKKWVKIIMLLATFALSAWCVNFGGIGVIFVFYVIMLALILQLVNFILKKSFKQRFKNGFSLWKKIYGSGLVPVFVTVLVLIMGYFNLHNVVETKYTVYTQKDIRDEGYRVALIADVHFGVSLNYDEMLEKCEEISSKDLDMVILCGDIVDNSTSTEQTKQVFKALSTIKSEYGVFYTYGNHDRPMSLLKSEFTENELIRIIERDGITILKDEIFEIGDDFVLVGRDDRSVDRGEKPRLSIDELMKKVDKSNFILTLDHQPNQYAENGKAGTDLIISGHTHGGQIFPINIVQELIKFNDGVYGRYQIDNDTEAIVTSGFAGWSYPVKTASPAEYVIIDIKHK